jgi:hypothetical protein
VVPPHWAMCHLVIGPSHVMPSACPSAFPVSMYSATSSFLVQLPHHHLYMPMSSSIQCHIIIRTVPHHRSVQCHVSSMPSSSSSMSPVIPPHVTSMYSAMCHLRTVPCVTSVQCHVSLFYWSKSPLKMPKMTDTWHVLVLPCVMLMSHHHD